jgi:predicted nucleic acid-binding protein
MANEIFVDTSGFYALLVSRDPHHAMAKAVLRRAMRQKRRFITTDYILDETATLFKSRGISHLATALFKVVGDSRVCRIEWTDVSRFEAAQQVFIKHIDQSWSFTDGHSFHVMKDLRLRDALTKDRHFGEAGFTVLLVN